MPTSTSARAWRWETVWSWKDHSSSTSKHGFAALHPSDPGNEIHCGGWAEVWSSLDAGKRWSASGTLGRRGRTYVHGIWSRGAQVYAAATYGEIYVSGTRGRSWKGTSVGTQQHMNGVSGEPAGKRVYVVGGGGLALVSDDAGKRWKRLTTGTKAELFRVWVAPEDALQPGRVVTTGFGVCLWTDARGRWQQAALPAAASQGIQNLWASDGALFAADVLGHLLTSTDLGETWTLVGQTPCSWLHHATGDRSGKRVCIYGRASGKAFGCWLSSDGGKRWRRFAFKGSTEVTSLAFGPDGSLWVSASKVGMINNCTEILRGRVGVAKPAAKSKAKKPAR